MLNVSKSEYKETEIGVIPKDWNLDYVGNLAQIATGSKNTQDRISDGDYPFFVRSQTIERINSYSYDGEAILTAGDGVGTGKVFHYINGKFDAHQRVYRISDFNARINGYYFYLYFSNHFYNRIMKMTAKSSVDSVRREMIARMLVPIPPTLEEQTAIATALSDAQRLITSIETLIDKKRKIKQGVMQELLTGKKRLPGFNQKWTIKTLDEIADVDIENLKSDTDPQYSFKYISLEDVDQGKLTSYREITFSEAPSRARRVVRQGDVLVATVRPSLQSHLIIKYDLKNIICSTGFTVLRCKNEAIPAYVYFHLFGNIICRQIEMLLTGSNYPSINSKDVKLMEIPMPSVEEQTAIAQVLSDMDAEIDALKEKLSKYKSIKQGMMQELLTGKTRLV